MALRKIPLTEFVAPENILPSFEVVQEEKLDEDSITLLLISIEARPNITLEEMRNKLFERGITVSISTIARYLERCLIIVKKT